MVSSATRFEPLAAALQHLDEFMTIRELEQQLLEDRLRLAAILQTSTDAIVVIDDRGVIQSFNGAAERMFSCSEHDVLGTDLERFVPERFVGAYRAGLERFRHSDLPTGTPGQLSLSCGLAADGREFPCEAWAAQHTVGGHRQFIVFVRDITDRHRFEQALRQRTEFETFLFNLSSTFIGLPDERVDAAMEGGLATVGEFLQMDRITLLELAANKSEMVVAYSWTAPGVPNAAARITQQAQPWWMRQVLRGDVSLTSRVDDLPSEAGAEKAYLRERGVSSAASIPLKVGGDIAGAITFVTIHRQVSWDAALVAQLKAIGDILWNALKRRQAMQELLVAQSVVRESGERFRLAMNNVAAGVYTLDEQGLVTYVNPAAEQMFGWTMAELIGRKMHDVAHYKHPDGTPFPASECPALQVLRNGVELREHADVFVRKDGTCFPVVYSASPLRKHGTAAGIVVGFRDDTKRLEDERMIRESETRFRLIASTVPAIIWIVDEHGQTTYVNELWTTFTGLSQEEALGDSWSTVMHPDDLERTRETFANAFNRRGPFHIEHRLRRHDGEFRWIFTQGVPRYNADQSFGGYIGSAVDVTDRKEAEQLLSTLSQRLIEAQEQERARVARELHDDICQRLALLLLSLEGVKQLVTPSGNGPGQELGHAIEATAALAADVQSLSRRLHSPKLMMGLAAAALGFCREVSERSRLEVRFQAEGDTAHLSEDVALCLYRVLQEALQNAVKHSGSHRVDVSLQRSALDVALTVRDSGIGFQLDEVLKGRRGLGLVSMKERLKLVVGELTIDSRPQYGTTIRACVPLTAASPSGVPHASITSLT
jgi:PAS domain S-box-containing protein